MNNILLLLSYSSHNEGHIICCVDHNIVIFTEGTVLITSVLTIIRSLDQVKRIFIIHFVYLHQVVRRFILVGYNQKLHVIVEENIPIHGEGTSGNLL